MCAGELHTQHRVPLQVLTKMASQPPQSTLLGDGLRPMAVPQRSPEEIMGQGGPPWQLALPTDVPVFFQASTSLSLS